MGNVNKRLFFQIADLLYVRDDTIVDKYEYMYNQLLTSLLTNDFSHINVGNNREVNDNE